MKGGQKGVLLLTPLEADSRWNIRSIAAVWIGIYALLLMTSPLFAAPPSVTNGISKTIDIKAVLSKKSEKLCDVRIKITHEVDRGMSRHLDTSIVEVGIDRSMVSVGFRNDYPDQQTIRFLKDGVQVQYLGAAFNSSGEIEALKDNGMISATIRSIDSLSPPLDFECIQLDAIRRLPEGAVSIDEQGRFRVTARDGHSELEGSFDLAREVLLRLRGKTTNNVWEYRYEGFTNISNLVLPTQVTLFAEMRGAGSSMSKNHFEYQRLEQQPNMKGFIPPPGTEVSDERSSPTVTYLAINRPYTDQELAAMRQNPKPSKPVVPPSAVSSVTSSVLFSMGALVVLALVGGLVYWKRSA